jgi:pyridoxal 5'-phosphate synthase pdxT subunit
MIRVGILALQGAITPHFEILKLIPGYNSDFCVTRVTNALDIAQVDGIIIPGGESTTMLKLLKLKGMFDILKNFCLSKPCWGICAGAILLAKEVKNPNQESLEVVDIVAERNAYGSQVDSFKSEITFLPYNKAIEADFIRAPALSPLKNTSSNHKLEALATFNTTPYMFQQGKALVSAFHTELGSDPLLHQYFLSLCAKN